MISTGSKLSVCSTVCSTEYHLATQLYVSCTNVLCELIMDRNTLCGDVPWKFGPFGEWHFYTSRMDLWVFVLG